MVIKQIIEQSLIVATEEPDKGRNTQFIHRNRSKNFVEAFASQLREEYKEKESIYVLSKHCSQSRTEFGLNELLYDILVCETKLVLSVTKKENLTLITRAIWEIESEFAPNSREAIYDFNKLILGSGENKLFIGPKVSSERDFLHLLGEAVKYCQGNIFVSFVSHPSEWRTRKHEVKCWQFINGWIEL